MENEFCLFFFQRMQYNKCSNSMIGNKSVKYT